MMRQVQHLVNKLISAYYGCNSCKGMKIICVSGDGDLAGVAKLLYNILLSASQRVCVLATNQPMTAGMLYKFISDSWKSGASYVICTAPMATVKKGLFNELEIAHLVVTPEIDTESVEAIKQLAGRALYSVLPKDYHDFTNLVGALQPLSIFTYGDNVASDLEIAQVDIYKKGVQLKLIHKGEEADVASLMTGDYAVSAMAAAAAAAVSMHYSFLIIVEGFAEYVTEITV